MIILRMPRLVLTVTLLLAGCGNAPPAAEADLGPRTETIYLIHRGWHTDIGLTIDKAGESFARLRGKFPDARTLVFGFGDRAYLLHRTYGIGEMLATLLPGPGTVLVTGLRQPPREAFSDQGVSALQVTTAGLARLDEFIAGSLEREPDGAPRDIGVGPYPDSNYYASTQRYSASFTCNTWTAHGLRDAGLPIRDDGVVTASGVTRQLREIAEAAR